MPETAQTKISALMMGRPTACSSSTSPHGEIPEHPRPSPPPYSESSNLCLPYASVESIWLKDPSSVASGHQYEDAVKGREHVGDGLGSKETVEVSQTDSPIGYCLAPQFPDVPMQLGDVVKDLSCLDGSLLLRLHDTGLPSTKQSSYRSFEFTISDQQSYNGVFSTFLLRNTVARATYSIQNLQLTEINSTADVFKTNHVIIADVLQSSHLKSAFLIYGVATAEVVRINRSAYERRGLRFIFSSRHGAINLQSATENKSHSAYTMKNSIVGFAVLRLSLKSGRIEADQHLISDFF